MTAGAVVVLEIILQKTSNIFKMTTRREKAHLLLPSMSFCGNFYQQFENARFAFVQTDRAVTALGRNYRLRSWFKIKQPEKSGSGVVLLLHRYDPPADCFPLSWPWLRAAQKRCFYTWVSTSVNSIATPPPRLSAPSLLCSSVNWCGWCDVKVMKFLLCDFFLAWLSFFFLNLGCVSYIKQSSSAAVRHPGGLPSLHLSHPPGVNLAFLLLVFIGLELCAIIPLLLRATGGIDAYFTG